MVKPPCSNFREITAIFSVVGIFRIFTVLHKDGDLTRDQLEEKDNSYFPKHLLIKLGPSLYVTKIIQHNNILKQITTISTLKVFGIHFESI